MKKLLLLSLVALTNLAYTDVTAYKKNQSVINKLHRIAYVDAELVKASYKARVRLEGEVKKLDVEFKKIHEKYLDARAKHMEDRDNKEVKKDYYNQRAEMVYALFQARKKYPSTKKSFDKYIKTVEVLREKALELLSNADDILLYEKTIEALNEMYEG